MIATFPVGNTVNSLAVHPDGTRMYAAHFASQVYASCTSSCLGYVSEETKRRTAELLVVPCET